MLHVCLLVLALAVESAVEQPLMLEFRVFLGSEDVTRETRIAVHRAGERGQPVVLVAAGQPQAAVGVSPGIYDAQAVRERDGRVLNIRWAERLVVMPYPDEAGHHLEVINFANGYGALQIRGASPAGLDDEYALFEASDRRETKPASTGHGYVLFVVPAGRYDIQARRGSRQAWHKAVDIPLDRTRLWMVPE
jgi:hypothetical protein